MTEQKGGKAATEGTSGLDQLKQQLAGYAEARGQQLVDKLGDKLNDVTQGLNDVGDGGGSDLLATGKRVLGGENPVKAFLGEKAGSLKDKAVDSAKNAFGGGGKKSGTTKVTNIVEVLDIGIPIRTVYDRWTQLEEFNSFAKGVTSVTQSDEVESDWKLKIAFSNRSWKATIQEQIPDQRIVWTSEGSKGSTHGAVSFHELTPELTRIVVVVEYSPSGFFEKTGNIWRAQGRRLRLDLKHFQRYVTLTENDDVEGWRGEIRDGEVVRSHEEGLEDDEPDEDDESTDEAGGEDEDGEPDEDEGEGEAEDEEEDEEEEGEAEDGEYEDEEEAEEEEE